MWVLIGNERSPETTHHLLCNRDILVGRRTDIRLEDDKSISRTHACIHITYQQEDMLSPSARGRVILSDRSKYGTSVDGQRMEGDRVVGDGSVITFGLQWNTWTLRWRPLSVVMSLVPRSDRDTLHSLLVELGGTLLSEWTSTVDFLIMTSFKMSIKAVQALASGTPVVTPHYLRESAACWRVSPTAPAVSPADFQPAFDEPTLNGSDYDIGALPGRRTLFFGKRFVFAEESRLQQMRLAIELAGGTPLLLSRCGLAPSEMVDRDVIVMHTDVKSPEVNRLKAVLKRAKRRLVQDQEIGLAVLRCSTERDCNPAFDYRATFLPPLASTQSQSTLGPVLAKETQPPGLPPTSKATSADDPATPAAAGRTVRVIPPTPSTPGASDTATLGADGVIAPTPSTPGASDTATLGADGVIAPTPSTPGASLVPQSSASRVTRSSPRRTSGASRPRAAPTEEEEEAGSAEDARRPPSDGAEPDSKRARREPDSVTQSLLLDAEDLLSGSLASGRRQRDTSAEESQPATKRARLSGGARARAAPAAEGDDLFDFDLESAGRPAQSLPPPKTEVKKEPCVIPETPQSREPAPTGPVPSVKQEPAADGDWMSSARRAAPRAPSPPTRSPPRAEQVSVAADDHVSSLIGSCVRLQISSLICANRSTSDVSAAADTSANGPNFKRFRRAHQPLICPRIIGGTDLFVAARRRTPYSNGHADAGGAGDLRDEARRQAEADDELLRLLDGVGRAAGRRR